MKLKILALVSLVAVTTACDSKSAPNRASTTGPGSGAASTGTGTNISTSNMTAAQEADVLAKYKAKAVEFDLVRNINQGLCERLQRLRNECVPAARLVADTNQQLLTCVTSAGALPTTNPFQWSVSVRGTTTQFKIIADNTFETNAFGDGDTAIIWTAITATAAAAPRLSDLTSLRLKPVNGPLPALGSTTIDLKVNDKIAFNTADLTTEGTDNTFFLFRLTKFIDIMKSSACKVATEEVKVIEQQARNRMTASGAVLATSSVPPTTNVTTSTAVTASISTSTSTAVATSTTPVLSTTDLGTFQSVTPTSLSIPEGGTIEQRAQVIITNLSTLTTSCDRENDRNGKLKAELSSSTAYGCKANEPIQKFELLINGGDAGELEVLCCTDSNITYPNVYGSPNKFQFDFGFQMGISQ